LHAGLPRPRFGGYLGQPFPSSNGGTSPPVVSCLGGLFALREPRSDVQDASSRPLAAAWRCDMAGVERPGNAVGGSDAFRRERVERGGESSCALFGLIADCLDRSTVAKPPQMRCPGRTAKALNFGMLSLPRQGNALPGLRKSRGRSRRNHLAFGLCDNRHNANHEFIRFGHRRPSRQ
jgi:hypothetical protein